MIPPLQRLIALMSQTFKWSEARIAAYLQAEGEVLSPAEVRELLQSGLKQLQQALPGDIRAIYFGEEETVQEEDFEIDLASSV